MNTPADKSLRYKTFARGIVQNEARLCGLQRVAQLARCPETYQGSIDDDISREALYPYLQSEAQALLNVAAE